MWIQIKIGQWQNPKWDISFSELFFGPLEQLLKSWNNKLFPRKCHPRPRFTDLGDGGWLEDARGARPLHQPQQWRGLQHSELRQPRDEHHQEGGHGQLPGGRGHTIRHPETHLPWPPGLQCTAAWHPVHSLLRGRLQPGPQASKHCCHYFLNVIIVILNMSK